MTARTPTALKNNMPIGVVGGTSVQDIHDLLDTLTARTGASVTEYGAVADDLTDCTTAINDALSENDVVIIPPGAGKYRVTGQITVPAGKVLMGLGNPTVWYEGTTSGIAIISSGGVGASVLGLTVDGGNQNGVLPPFTVQGLELSHDDCLVRDVHLVNTRERGFYIHDCSGVRIEGGSSSNSSGAGMAVYNVTEGKFKDIDLTGNLSNFGCHVDQGTNNCTFDGLTAYNAGTGFTSLELLGLTYSCYDNKIINCTAEGCGDNGISVTGYNNTIANNICKGNYHSGIYCYGSNNKILGNQCENNNQGGAAFSGISVVPNWGGLAMRNVVVGNSCLDTQDIPTQYDGIRVGASAYTSWASGQTIDSLNDYRTNGLNVYKPTTTGTTGATAPTHTAGTASDGGVTWQYVGTADTNLHAKYNQIGPNTYFGNTNSEVRHDASQANTITKPGELEIALAADPTNSIKIITDNASPVTGAGYAAPVGSLFIRNGGSSGISLYVKVSSSDTGWKPLGLRDYGSTANRPSNVTGSGYTAYFYFDTTLGKPIWYNGTNWVDATGTVV